MQFLFALDFFRNVYYNYNDVSGGASKGKDALSVCAQGLCKDAKPTKHTQTLALRKVSGIVQKISLMVGMV